MTGAPLRDGYPGAARRPYLDTAALGLAPRAAAEAVARCLRELELDPRSCHHGSALDEARRRAAALVGAAPREIALTPSTSLALLVAADAIPLRHGDNVITTNLEFISVVAPWLEKCRRERAELRVVRHERGRVDPERVVAAIDGRTRAVVLSSVQWTNGFRVPLAPIGEACRSRSIPLVVDGIQHVGALDLDVRAASISVLACGGHKWLGCPSAYGFLFASDEFAARFRPSLPYAPTTAPAGGVDWREAWTDPGFDPVRAYEPAAGARRFELGVHHGVLGAVALAASIAVLSRVDAAAREAHVLRLAGRVADGASALGLSVASPQEPEARSGITVLRAGADRDADLRLARHLGERGIAVSTRYTSGEGGVRVSTHVYNDDADVETLLAAIEEWVRRERSRPRRARRETPAGDQEAR